MTGHSGNDVYVVDNVGDSVVEAGGGGTDTVESSITISALFAEVENLTLTGGGAINGTGNALGNTITGNSGINTLTGGAGDDIYVVQNATDTVVENAAEGTDRVNSSVTYTISDVDVENLTLTGSGNINGIGNASANTITGNSGDNELSGLGGIDVLSGGDGADTLNGGTGNDALTGGAGADTFVVSAAFDNDTIADFVVGTDKIDLTAVTPGSFADLLAATTDVGGSAVITLTGGTITLTGVLEADLSGSDFIGLTGITGTIGDDTLVGTAGADVIDGGNGKDTISGLGGADNLIGGNGIDTLAGGEGADTLTGNNGNDDFYYGATSEGGDTVTDFASGTDGFVFLQSAFGGGSLSAGTLDASNFSIITEAYDGTNGTSAAATGNTAGFVYDSTNGVLSYDSNGNAAGGGFTIATLSSGSVAASDIEITAASPV